MQKNTIPGVKSLADLEYEMLYGFFPRGKTKGHTVAIAYGKRQVLPWAVGYCGSSQYFRTLPEAVAYCVGRGFILWNESDKLTASISRHLTE